MKILILFIFFASLFYYLSPADQPQVVDLDEIRVKIAAPKREGKPRNHRHVVRAPAVEEEVEAISDTAKELIDTNIAIEETWETSLRQRLMDLDPALGAEIFEQYKQEKDRYSLELERLVKEHQESDELDHMIDELDFGHQQKLQDIFGPYFEDLRDLQVQANQ